MNKLAKSLLFSGMLLSCVSTAQAEVRWVDQIVALAGDEIITQSELANETQFMSAQLRSAGRDLPAATQLQKEVLEQLILNKLQLQRAKERGIKIDDLTLDDAVKGIAKDNGMSLNRFRQELTREGITYRQFREDVRKELAITSLRQREVLNQVRISETEVNDALRQHRKGEAESSHYQISHILLSISTSTEVNSSSADKIREKARSIRQQAAQGSDFATLARQHSESGSASSGGDLGLRKFAQIPTLFSDTVSGMREGEISNVIESGKSLHIIKLVKKQSSAPTAQIQEFNVRHILVSTAAKGRTDQQAEKQLYQVRQQIMRGESFSSLAKKYSDDPGSGKRGGELGWAPASTYVGAFAEQIEKTPAGEITEPFQSEFGWHILQVQGERQTTASDEHLKSRARAVLMKRKQAQELQNWLSRLRDEAFVEYRVGPQAKL